MEKIEVLKEILGTNKIAYNADYREAMWCNSNLKVVKVIVQDGFDNGVDAFVNHDLWQVRWEVTEEEYENPEEFEFPPMYKELTIEEVPALLSRHFLYRQAMFSNDRKGWVGGILEGVQAGDYPFLGFIASREGYKYCRIQVSIEDVCSSAIDNIERR